MSALDMSHEWYGQDLPANIEVDDACFIQSSYAFTRFRSKRAPGLVMARGSGVYSQSQLIVGEGGQIRLGQYACLNSATLYCDRSIEIGAHCLLAWGTVIMDRYPETPDELAASSFPDMAGEARPVVLEDNVWVGFDSVVMPGVRLGEGCIIGCKSVVTHDIPAGAVAVGAPARVIR